MAEIGYECSTMRMFGHAPNIREASGGNTSEIFVFNNHKFFDILPISSLVLIHWLLLNNQSNQTS